MAEVKYSNDRSWAPREAAPFWMVYRDGGRGPEYRHDTAESAETEAARLATLNPGDVFFILAVTASISTNIEVVGEKFDPSKSKPKHELPEALPDCAPEFAEVDEPTPLPAFLVPDDDKPF